MVNSLIKLRGIWYTRKIKYLIGLTNRGSVITTGPLLFTRVRNISFDEEVTYMVRNFIGKIIYGIGFVLGYIYTTITGKVIV